MKTLCSRIQNPCSPKKQPTLLAQHSSSKEVPAFADLFQEALPSLSKRGSKRNESEPPLKRSTSTGTSLAPYSGLTPSRQPSLQRKPSSRKQSRKFSLAGSDKLEPKSAQRIQAIDGEPLHAQPAQEDVNKVFQKELTRVYNEVDRFSNLLWAQKTSDGLCDRKRGSDAKPMLRSGLNDEDKQMMEDWERENCSSVGYGEITKGALTKFLTYFQNADRYVKESCEREGTDLRKLPFALDEYAMTPEISTFLDIGSGFGKPNFHAAMQTAPKESKGVEIVPARVHFCIDQQFNFQERYTRTPLRGCFSTPPKVLPTARATPTTTAQSSAVQLPVATETTPALQLQEALAQVEKLTKDLPILGIAQLHQTNLKKLKTALSTKLEATTSSTPVINIFGRHVTIKENNEPQLAAMLTPNWCECLSFEVCNAAKPAYKYVDRDGVDFSHIYSYNKVMSLRDRQQIAKILNKTNFKMMAWYFNPKESAQCGLKRVRLAFQMPMQSTGKEKFTVYAYYKTAKYEEDKPWSDYESDSDSNPAEATAFVRRKKPSEMVGFSMFGKAKSGRKGESLLGKRK